MIATGRRARPAKRAAHAISRSDFPGQVVLVLQGGGALGAYHVGVFQALHEAGIEPDWVIGTSIGAINAALIAGNAPDTALVKFNNLTRLMQMESLHPLDSWIDAWPGKADISDDLWRLHTAPDGKRYYVPLQYVILYLYVRLDLLAKQNMKPSTNFDELKRSTTAQFRPARNATSEIESGLSELCGQTPQRPSLRISPPRLGEGLFCVSRGVLLFCAGLQSVC